MSKTVLLPDELYKEIQETNIKVHWVIVEQSMAKKIKLFFDVYSIERAIEEWVESFESFKTNNREVYDNTIDSEIRSNELWDNPWKIVVKLEDVTL